MFIILILDLGYGTHVCVLAHDAGYGAHIYNTQPWSLVWCTCQWYSAMIFGRCIYLWYLPMILGMVQFPVSSFRYLPMQLHDPSLQGTSQFAKQPVSQKQTCKITTRFTTIFKWANTDKILAFPPEQTKIKKTVVVFCVKFVCFTVKTQYKGAGLNCKKIYPESN